MGPKKGWRQPRLSWWTRYLAHKVERYMEEADEARLREEEEEEEVHQKCAAPRPKRFRCNLQNQHLVLG